MNNTESTLNLEGMDPQLVSASLCYLITLHAKGHSENLSVVVMQHLQILVKLNEHESPEAVATYRKLMDVWQKNASRTEFDKVLQSCCTNTIH